MKNNLTKVIALVSVLIPLAVAFLLFMPSKISFFGEWTYKLPHFNAIINSLTSLLLVLSFYAIKYKKNIILHQNLNTMAFTLGAIFLVSYIIYHSSVDSTKYLGDSKTIYYFFLISHIILSIVVVPFVLFAFYYSLTNKIKQHKKVVKYTFPIWLYVSVSGVIVYFMISPFYQF
ncbi:MAG: DUF420 domain-containing protein [Cytophagales bacterium]|nr:hypothetical protein [Marinoscillum sp.]OUX26716.1 MAG: hypothetical protein CBE22_02120 [Flammeovirgaceae bacterium TMED262]PDH45339.1 MAG: hypothetical protein CNE34_02115 [Rhodothermaeota bacterium MED-G18]|tara:strand:- start:2305 stop:2826 length:522 start_codon:yes stop_codon:yes gene_type:complete